MKSSPGTIFIKQARNCLNGQLLSQRLAAGGLGIFLWLLFLGFMKLVRPSFCLSFSGVVAIAALYGTSLFVLAGRRFKQEK